MVGRDRTLLVMSKMVFDATRRGCPLLVVSRLITQRRGVPLSSCMDKNTMGKGFPPSCHVCVETNTTEKGETPSRRVCVERDTTGRGDPLVASV
jgi:hypothetical protein